MTPAARYAAAITVLDLIDNETVAEKVLTTWARQNRYAGSKDRAAIRDHVYDVLRQRQSLAALGGGTDGRRLVLGLLRQQGIDPNAVFGAGGYGPPALEEAEAADQTQDIAPADAADIPQWLWPMWCADLGDHAADVAGVLQTRAPVSLRVNLKRGTRDDAQAALRDDGIICRPIDDVKTALQVLENPRQVAASQVFQDGRVELQDVASQRAMLALVDVCGASVLDYCAGGGGKALALADLTEAAISAHDIAVQRMDDIAPRAARAGVKVSVLEGAPETDFDLVLCDAPCSGSGTWRRTPDAKWKLTPDRLAALTDIQDDVIRAGAARVSPGGVLAYATCSVLSVENGQIVDQFIEDHREFKEVRRYNWHPDATQDGFFLAILKRV